jgi:hypothetical protein
MRRFIMTRWWACILAIGLSITVPATRAHATYSDPTGGSGYGDGSGSGQSGIGDPDMPTTPGKSRSGLGRATSPVSDGIRSVGDGRALNVMRIKLMLQSLRMQIFGF